MVTPVTSLEGTVVMCPDKEVEGPVPATTTSLHAEQAARGLGVGIGVGTSTDVDRIRCDWRVPFPFWIPGMYQVRESSSP